MNWSASVPLRKTTPTPWRPTFEASPVWRSAYEVWTLNRWRLGGCSPKAFLYDIREAV